MLAARNTSLKALGYYLILPLILFKLNYQNNTHLPLNGTSLFSSVVAEPVEALF